MKICNIKFERNKNEIDENSYIFWNEKIKNLADSLIEYYNFEKEGKGYLVERWKKLCNYEVFKNGIKEPNSELIKYIYFYQKDLPKLKPFHFNNIKTAFENNSLVLINSNFYNIIKENIIKFGNALNYIKYRNNFNYIFFYQEKNGFNF